MRDQAFASCKMNSVVGYMGTSLKAFAGFLAGMI